MPIKEFGDQVPGAIVRSWAQATSGYDEIGARHRVTNCRLYGGGGVIDCDLARDSVSPLRKLAAEPLLMRVEDVTEHQFASGVDDFDVHVLIFSVSVLETTNKLQCIEGMLTFGMSAGSVSQMKTVTLRTLLREPIKVKRMTRSGQSVQVTDKGQPLWILQPVGESPEDESKRKREMDEEFERIKKEGMSDLPLSKIVLDLRR